ncbi:MAG: DUF2779 domain-containing protein [Nitrospinae bacterium]|nr:DUF2779 domain-containing protein [Nitrospinota bacterium]
MFDISTLSIKEKFKLYSRGIIDIKDLPKNFPLSPSQKLQVDCEIDEKPHINREEIQNFLSKINYPLYFLDFEAFQEPIPLFDKIKPYQQLPFQFSLHYIEEPNWNGNLSEVLKHEEFLAKTGTDPREEIASNLVRLIPENASVLCYDKSFEKLIIKGLASDFPQYKEKLLNINKNLLDMMTPFREMHLYKREMKGRHSIKAVLPALVPELRYDELAVSNGRAACTAYAKLSRIDNKEEIERLSKGLLEYCKLDTFAMVKILEKLYEIVSEK